MTATFDADEGNFIRVDGPQVFTVYDWDEPVFCAMEDVRMALNKPDPFIGA